MVAPAVIVDSTSQPIVSHLSVSDPVGCHFGKLEDAEEHGEELEQAVQFVHVTETFAGISTETDVLCEDIGVACSFDEPVQLASDRLQHRSAEKEIRIVRRLRDLEMLGS